MAGGGDRGMGQATVRQDEREHVSAITPLAVKTKASGMVLNSRRKGNTAKQQLLNHNHCCTNTGEMSVAEMFWDCNKIVSLGSFFAFRRSIEYF